MHAYAWWRRAEYPAGIVGYRTHLQKCTASAASGVEMYPFLCFLHHNRKPLNKGVPICVHDLVAVQPLNVDTKSFWLNIGQLNPFFSNFTEESFDCIF